MFVNRLRKIQCGAVRLMTLIFKKALYFTPILFSNWKFRRYLLLPLYKEKNYSITNDKSVGERDCSATLLGQKTIVYMVQPETTFSGGLSDRLRGITSIYAECKRQGLPFRIVFEPLRLTDYLAPNRYDWQISKEDIIWDVDRCYPCSLLTFHSDLNNPLQRFAQKMILRFYIGHRAQQIHVYSNMATEESCFRELFNELFKPSKELEKQLEYHLEKLGGKGCYISMTFRFRQLLGDFKEGGDVLPAEKREEYIQLCIKCVERIHQQTIGKKILVTADSSLFLDKLYSKIYEDGNSRPSTNQDWLYIIPGKVVHMGFTFDADEKVYMKSFVDFFMLSYASVTYQVTDKLLMNSGFPKRASMLGENQYKEVRL